MKKKQTRREKSLAEMDAVVPWTRLLALIELHYQKAGPKGGRLPMPLETMLRVYLLQKWYALSDPMAEEMLYDSDARQHFAGIKLGDDRIPDETTIWPCMKYQSSLSRRSISRVSRSSSLISALASTHSCDRIPCCQDG